jgi:hypothetical protein
MRAVTSSIRAAWRLVILRNVVSLFQTIGRACCVCDQEFFKEVSQRKPGAEPVSTSCRSALARCHYRTDILRLRELPFSDAWLDNGAVLVRRPASVSS